LSPLYNWSLRYEQPSRTPQYITASKIKQKQKRYSNDKRHMACFVMKRIHTEKYACGTKKQSQAEKSTFSDTPACSASTPFIYHDKHKNCQIPKDIY
jgi:hypothetical protein